MKFYFESELYYRGVQFFQKRLSSLPKYKKDGSTLPLAPRQHEEIKMTGLSSSTDLLAFYIGCTIISYENDFALSKILNHILRMAQRYNFTGKWKIWQDYIEYFNIESEDSYGKNINVIETCFDIPEIFIFLNQHFSEDEIFGNILNRSVKLISALYKIRPIKYVDRRPVIKPQRARGYKDKGSLASFDTRARRLANMENIEPTPRVKYDSSSDIQLWGQPPEDNNEEGV